MLGNVSDPLGYPVDPEAIELVLGKALLIGHYGRWPDFHDAEVIRVTMERAPTDLTATSNLRVVFYTFDSLREAGDPDRKQAHTELLFSEVGDFVSSGWNHQNPIIGVSITREYSVPMDAAVFRVFWGGCGHEVNLTCSRIAVMDVVDLNPFRRSLPELTP